MNTPTEVIQEWTARMLGNPAKAAAMDATFKFIVTGNNGGVWRFACKEPVSVSEGEGPADCTVQVEASDFVALGDKKLNPQEAFILGKLKLSGDITQALKLVDFI